VHASTEHYHETHQQQKCTYGEHLAKRSLYVAIFFISFCCHAVGPAPIELESVSHGAEQGNIDTQAVDESFSFT